MATILERGRGFLRDFAARLSVSRDDEPIDTAGKLVSFLGSRAAFVAQHKLYGYLKTRMGTRYPRMFEDEVFLQSVNTAKMHVFAACLSDLTVHATAKATAGSGLDHGERVAFAAAMYRACIAEHVAEAPHAGDPAEWNAAFARRLENVNWENLGAGADAFTESPEALVRWAPIAEELKRYDAEIVRNSVRYAWNEVIRDLRLRLDAGSVQRDTAAAQMD